jgi:hypothetical protein
MEQHYINKLRSTLQLNLKWNKSRIKFLTNFLTLMILTASVKLNRISLLMSGAKSESNYRKIQRFFKLFEMDYEEYSRFVLGLLSSQSKYYLVIDRTNWKFGKSDINILMLGIIYKNNCFPLFWELLAKGGSSSTQERKALLKKAIKLLGKDRILGLLGDREFIGVHWFRYLISEQIEFHIRIPKQVKAGSPIQKHRRTVEHLFRYCKENTKMDYPKAVKILGFKLYVSGMKSNKGYCIVVSSKSNLNSLEKYQMRWTIENMFGAFKKRVFNFEDTHMTKLEKIKKLLVLISIAYTWCVLVGLWVSEKTKIRIMKHGRKQRSIFRCGFDYLTTFIEKLLTGNIYNDLEFNDVTKILSCT